MNLVDIVQMKFFDGFVIQIFTNNILINIFV